MGHNIDGLLHALHQCGEDDPMHELAVCTPVDIVRSEFINAKTSEAITVGSSGLVPFVVESRGL